MRCRLDVHRVTVVLVSLFFSSADLGLVRNIDALGVTVVLRVDLVNLHSLAITVCLYAYLGKVHIHGRLQQLE